MKTNIGKLIGLALVVGQVVCASAQTVESQTQGPVTVKWYSASLPREDSTMVAQGSSWFAASNNWMQAIRTDAAAVGSGRDEAKKITYNDYLGMISSPGINSWRGIIQPSWVEFGNRQHYGFKVFAQTGSFVPANITYSITTQAWNGSNWVNQLYVGMSSSMAQDNNSFRQRLNAGQDGVYGTTDDVVSASQTTASPSNGFIFGGYGIGVGAYGNGTDQDKLNNALAYMQGNKFRVVVTVTVPHTSGTYAFTNIYMPPARDMSVVKAVYTPPFESGGQTFGARVSWPSDSTGLYLMEKSTDLTNWTSVGYYAGGSGVTSVGFPEQMVGIERCFYRLKGW